MARQSRRPEPAGEMLAQPRRRGGFAAIAGRLTGINSIIVLLAFLTSPILARALGPSGRGELAAIFVVLTLAPTLADFGLYLFIARERALRLRSLGVLLGSILPVGFVIAMVGVLLAVPIAHLIGRGRDTVTLFIELGLFLLPLSVLLQSMYGVVLGDQRWAIVMRAKLIGAGGSAVAIVVLSLTDTLSVVTVSVTYLVSGLLANLPFLAGLRGVRPWRFEPAVAREGLAFGARCWLASLAAQTNAKLDQLLMAAIVSTSELGLYALAVTLATATTSLTGAVITALLPRVAGGEPTLAARACRVTILVVSTYAIALIVTSPFVVPFVFGSAFADLVPMLALLLIASVVAVPGQVLGSALIASGHPGASARSQTLALAVTVPGLIVALPLAGGVGAAAVSLLAYTVASGVVVSAALRRFSLPMRSFLLLNAEDLRWLRSRLPAKRRQRRV